MSVFNASAASAKNVEEKLVTHVIEHLCDQGSTERSAHQTVLSIPSLAHSTVCGVFRFYCCILPFPFLEFPHLFPTP